MYLCELKLIKRLKRRNKNLKKQVKFLQRREQAFLQGMAESVDGKPRSSGQQLYPASTDGVLLAEYHYGWDMVGTIEQMLRYKEDHANEPDQARGPRGGDDPQ